MGSESKRSRGGDNNVQRYKGKASVNPSNIVEEKDMIVERGNNEAMVDAVLTVSRDMLNDYPNAPLEQLFIATLKGDDAYSTLGYYDGANIAINRNYFNEKMENAYIECVKQGFHPSNGNKTGLQAVAAHEFGHAVTDAVGRKMGIVNIQDAATSIVNEARKATKHKGVVQMASKISKYATANNAEAVAEAICDVYCNGKKAKAESHAIVDVCKKYLK